MLQEFAVNEFITLKYDNGSTRIYVNGVYHNQCKYLLLSIPLDEMGEWDHYDSMDEIIKATSETRGGGEQHASPISKDEAFWGHCSNLQAWVDHGYDYRLLDTRLSIPIIIDIMKTLVKAKEKERFSRFFLEVVNSLDDYIINSRANEATWGKFQFLYKILFRKHDRYFTDEEIKGSIALTQLYDQWLGKKIKERQRASLLRWERKLWGRPPVVEGEFGYFVGKTRFYNKHAAERESKRRGLEYRVFLRKVRNHDETTLVSDEIDYLPYLYSTGKFTNCGSLSIYYTKDRCLIMRDEKGYYWKQGVY